MSGDGATIDGGAGGPSLEVAEESALATIAASDSRFAKRLPNAPSEERVRAATVAALAQGDADVSVRDGVLDFFSFSARARALDEAARIAASAKDGAKNSTNVDSTLGSGSGGADALERLLLTRLIDEERARLADERSLPRGASALIRGIVDTWPTASPIPQEAAERDTWLARRLDVVRGSIPGSALARDAFLELDDALDPIERITAAEGLASSARSVAQLRMAIADVPPSSSADETKRARIEAGVKTHLGLSIDAAELHARLERAEKATRAAAKEAVGTNDERAIAKRAEDLALTEGRCDASPSESRIRALAPPPERAAICGLLHTLSDAGTADRVNRAAALVALHDDTVVALWALAIHTDGAASERVIATTRPFFGTQPDREAKLARFAEARPVAAIAVGLAGDLLLRALPQSGDPHPENATSGIGAGAGRWLSFGDAPLDVVERALFSSAPTAAALTSGRAPPASPRP